MPKRTDIERILIIGSGPIIIGQACEFDYSGTQACKALREEDYEVVLVNSNPATIMTDPEMADRTYIEPLTVQSVSEILAIEKPDVLLPTLGGQTGLNLALQLAETGALSRYNVELIGATRKAIKKAEDRELFKDAMVAAGLEVPRSGFASNLREARLIAEAIGFPLIIRPSGTLGGSGGGIASNMTELDEVCTRGIDASPMNEVLVEESVVGWKEYELELMRDRKDNSIVVCSIENLDPMGIHTGDSITVAPAQTVTDREYQLMRNQALRVMREIGVDSGGANIQFAVNPRDGRVVVIEMNPRVSRSSALASKATGFPIARIAAKLAVGYTLDELRNEIAPQISACFEPSIDYVVTKIPRWAFEKFPTADPTLMTQMKSVGEAMAIGRTFQESLQKCIRSLEIGRLGLGADGKGLHYDQMPADELSKELQVPHPDRLFQLRSALRAGMTVEQLYEITAIDPWFLNNIAQIVQMQDDIAQYRDADTTGKLDAEALAAGSPLPTALLQKAKAAGFSDQQIAVLTKTDPDNMRQARKQLGIEPVVKLVDTCAGEFEACTPYYYLTYETEDEHRTSDKKKVIILGAGPNRIGQGIEFDYCCVHAAFALSEDGYETIMVNSNPETVSTDYDTSDKLYFEPLTVEDLLNICDKEKPYGVMMQFGGQTPLNLARELAKHGVPILGTSSDSIDQAEDRKRFKRLLDKLGCRQPDNDTVTTVDEAIHTADAIGYPVVVRPSYVLGGRAMQVVYNDESLAEYMSWAVEAAGDHPILIDKFLEDAVEIDVDAVADGERCVIGGIMEHIEEAGIHSGDSACVLPAFSLAENEIEQIREQTRAIALELNVKGLLNIQYAIRNEQLYVLEVNPRASRTVPYVSKAIGVPLAKIAARVMVGQSLEQLGFTEEVQPPHMAVKCPVFPFSKFAGVDILLGPEMKSTGEVMGIDKQFGAAFAKAYIAAGHDLPDRGTIFISVRNRDKRDAIFLAKRLSELGFELVATRGTAQVLSRAGVKAEEISRLSDPGGGRNAVDWIRDGRINLVINTPTAGQEPREDQLAIRREAVLYKVPCITTMAGAMVAALGLEALREGHIEAKPLQEYHRTMLQEMAVSRR
ncbi:MAG: carbamoyl-phosphate synthase large subunit [candidate division WS1 bacterium]|nr:carbamoyl-phosphate synthase large subunit [candidate division WS1 bacterium]